MRSKLPNRFLQTAFGALLLFSHPLSGFGAGKGFWDSIEKTKPVIKDRADAVLTQLGYVPEQLTAHVFFAGQGEELWTVAYWRVPPEDIVMTPRNLEVYLNVRGEVKRVVKFEQGKEELIYGKDERIDNGMTSEQVRERLGEPDYIGLPPRWSRRHGDDEYWRYNKTLSRTMIIEICFKKGKVSFVSHSGD